MKVVSSEAFIKFIQLVKSAFIKVEDTIEAQTIDVYSKSEIDANKQDKLTPGSNITIDENNVISSTGGSKVIFKEW